MVTEYASGAVVYKSNNDQVQYLLLKSASAGFWGIPKGHVEPEENLEQTAIREIKEETGLEVQLDTGFNEKVEYDMNNGHHKDITFFAARADDRVEVTRQQEEISEFGWFTFTQAVETLSYENLKYLLIDANKYIEQKDDLGGKIGD